MKKLSIIIPHYNSPKLLEQLLRSIPKIDQIEVIVIDDNSNKYIELYEKLKKDDKYKHIKFMKNNTVNKGAGSCRNIGLSNAKGEWILFADADDYFTKSFYEIIEKYYESDYDVVYFKPTSIELDTQEISDRHLKYEEMVMSYINNKDLRSELLLRYRFIVPWSKLIKRNVIVENNIKFDNTIASNDVMFSTRVGKVARKIQASEDIIYCVTRSKGSLTTNISKEVYDARVDVFIDNYTFMKNNLSKKEFKIIEQFGLGHIINAIRYNLGFKTAFKYYVKLKKNNVKLIAFKWKYFNPMVIISKITSMRKSYKSESRYLAK